jgi:hypothetical protein
MTMWIVDRALKARAALDRPIHVDIIGADFMARRVTEGPECHTSDFSTRYNYLYNDSLLRPLAA